MMETIIQVRELTKAYGPLTAADHLSLSGGERQRLFIVLALIPDPLVVFLDELTTGLDTADSSAVWREDTSPAGAAKRRSSSENSNNYKL